MQISDSLKHEAGALRVRYLHGLLIAGWKPVFGFLRSPGGADTQINKRSVDYVCQMHAMHARYIGGLLIGGCDAVFGVFRLLGRFLMQETIIVPHGSTRRILDWYGIDNHHLSGNSTIDTQHQGLIDRVHVLRIAILSGRSVDEVRATIDTLIRDVIEHFQDEETILAAAGYPEAAKHAALHRQLVNSAVTLVGRFRAGMLDIGDLFRFLADDVLAKHMLGADREFASMVNPRQREC